MIASWQAMRWLGASGKMDGARPLGALLDQLEVLINDTSRVGISPRCD